jgi:hypothetical protein
MLIVLALEENNETFRDANWVGGGGGISGC